MKHCCLKRILIVTQARVGKLVCKQIGTIGLTQNRDVGVVNKNTLHYRVQALTMLRPQMIHSKPGCPSAKSLNQQLCLWDALLFHQ